MWPDRVSNPGPLTCESGALPTALWGPAQGTQATVFKPLKFYCNFFTFNNKSLFHNCDSRLIKKTVTIKTGITKNYNMGQFGFSMQECL